MIIGYVFSYICNRTWVSSCGEYFLFHLNSTDVPTFCVMETLSGTVRGCEEDVDFSLLVIHHPSLLTGDIIRKSQIKLVKYLPTIIIRILSDSK